jgi:glycosyltransferase involved in cell wall biosynthesis
LRLAYCSPLPPAHSGIADYSAGLLAELETRCSELRLFNAGGAPVSASIQRRYEVEPLSELPKWTEREATLYQIGNEPRFHGAIYEMATRVPGVVVLHEFMLQHLIRGLTVDRRRTEEYVGIMRACYGERGELAARRYLGTGAARDLWTYPLFEPIVDASQGVIVHNKSARDRILSSRPEAEVEVVPPPLYGSSLPPTLSAVERAQVRLELGIPESSFVVASFGLLSEAKRLEVSLAAFASLRQQVPEARFFLVGDASPFLGLESLLQGELGTGVVVTGRQDLDRFVAYMQAVDVAVNLRYPFGGETSAAALHLLGLGQTVIVSEVGWMAEIPDGVVVKIAVDEREEQTLAAALWTLAEDRELRRALGANARRWVLAQHAPDRAADLYFKAIERLSCHQPRRSKSWLDTFTSKQALDLRERIVDEVGEALFDLGAEETEGDLLAETAEALEDLGLAVGP